MRVSIVDGRIVGYLTIREMAAKWSTTNAAIKQMVIRGQIDDGDYICLLGTNPQQNVYYFAEDLEKPTRRHNNTRFCPDCGADMRDKGGLEMKNDKEIIDILAKEIAYLQIQADYWYYVIGSKDGKEFADSYLNDAIEVKQIIILLGLSVSEVMKKALKIYDFSKSGKEDYEPDYDLIQKMEDDYCDKYKANRPLIVDSR